MGLKEAAKEKYDDKRDRERKYAQERADAERQKVVEKVAERLEKHMEEAGLGTPGEEPTVLEVFNYQYPKRYGQRALYGDRGHYITTAYSVYRVRVDEDVILWAWGDRGYTAEKIEPELTCSECGGRTAAEFCEEYVYMPDNLVEAIGCAQRVKVRCPHCTSGTPRECPTCGRSNF